LTTKQAGRLHALDHARQHQAWDEHDLDPNPREDWWFIAGALVWTTMIMGGLAGVIWAVSEVARWSSR
jgi:hypothetical protein